MERRRGRRSGQPDVRIASSRGDPPAPRKGGIPHEVRDPAEPRARAWKLHARLAEAGRATGRTGEAARLLIQVLSRHLLREEECASRRSGCSRRWHGERSPPTWRRSFL